MLNEGFSFLLKGGPVMWPLFLCAIVSVAVMIERFFALRAITLASSGLVRDTRLALVNGDTKELTRILQTREGPIAKILLTAVTNADLGRDQLEHLMEEIAIDETPPLSRGLGILDTIITIAPLLGLLGTVTGMIKAFQIVAATSGTRAPATITGGVAEALIATATGLVIAIVTLVGYNHLSGGVKQIVSDMESAATKVINVLDLQSKRDNQAARSLVAGEP